MEIVGVVLALVALGGLARVHLRSIERFEALETAPTPPPGPAYDDRAVLRALDEHEGQILEVMDDVAKLAERIDKQNLAISQGIEHVDRSERRVRAAVARARKRMAELGYEDEGLEAENEGLREIHGDGREVEGVQPLSGDVANGQPRDMSAFPGQW